MIDSVRLHALFALLKDIHTIREPVALWRTVIERSCQLLRAEAGSFFTLEPDGRMTLAAAVGVDEEQLRRVPLRVGTGLCGWVAEHRQPAFITDVRTDRRFNPMADQVTGLQTRSLLCVPVFFHEQTDGVLELVNGPFSAEDQEFIGVLAQHTAVAYHNLRLIRESSKSSVLLESLLGNMSGGLIAVESEGAVSLLNPSARALLGLGDRPAVGQPAAAVLMDYPVLLHALHRTLSRGTAVSRQEALLVIKGQSVRFGFSTILISDPQRTLLGAGIIFQRLS